MRNRLLVGLLLAASLSNAAFAGDKKSDDKPAYPEIKLTKIAEFDPTLSKAKDIHTTLESVENKLRDANKGLAASLNLPETTSLEDALAELKKKANNKVTVGLEKGRVPKLKATDAVPEEVQKGIDTVNGMMDDMSAALEQIEALPQAVTALVAEAKAFPGQLSPDLIKKNGLTAAELPKITKILGTDIKAIEATPERIKSVTDQTINMFQKVQNSFSN